jgi:phosphatidate phosphatase APP1
LADSKPGEILTPHRTPHQIVTFFPRFAALSADRRSWNISIHAWVYQPEEHSVSRRALLYLLSKKLGISQDAARSGLFLERAQPFLATVKRGVYVSVRLDEEIFEVGPSSANGHIIATLSIPTNSVEAQIPDCLTPSGRSIQFGADLLGQQRGAVSFSVPFIGPVGVSVISDIDDTIKVSNVANKRALLKNTFLREFEPLEGMPDLYQIWAAQGAAFHYVSASPWQLHSPLSAFLKREGFPSGSLSLKTFRWKDRSFFDLFSESKKIKRPLIEKILSAFPHRKFILVGDSEETDPELFASLMCSHSEQVQMICIRRSESAESNVSRAHSVFRELPAEKWAIFSHPRELIEKTSLLFGSMPNGFNAAND